MSNFAFTRGEKVHLLASALRAIIPLRLDSLPARGDNPPKHMPDKPGFVAAAHALDVVRALEYQIRKDEEYRESRNQGTSPSSQPASSPVDDVPF